VDLSRRRGAPDRDQGFPGRLLSVRRIRRQAILRRIETTLHARSDIYALSQRSSPGSSADLRFDLEYVPGSPDPGVRDSQVRRRFGLAEPVRAPGRGDL